MGGIAARKAVYMGASAIQMPDNILRSDYKKAFFTDRNKHD